MNSKEFLRTLYGAAKGLVEVRCLPSKNQLFTTDFEEIPRFVRGRTENIYFGVITRSTNRGTKKDVCELVALWADVDAKHFGGSKAKARKSIDNFPLAPSLIVRTGGGYHVYWLLDKPIPAKNEHEIYLKAISVAINGDPACAEIARILRLPGTFNYKYNPPRPVRVVSVNDRRYRLTQFKSLLNNLDTPIKPPESHFASSAHNKTEYKFGLSQRILNLIDNGPEGTRYPSRSEADQAVIAALLKKGATNNEIKEIFRTKPIGEKYRATGREGDRYLLHSIRRAQSFLGSRRS